jgi:hypothetical protein
VPEDVIAYNSSHGATLVTASPEQITFEHYLTLGKPLMWAGVLKIGEWVELDVTPAVTRDGVYNWGLITGSRSDLFFNSKENETNQPELVVETDASTTPSRFAPSDDTYVSSADEETTTETKTTSVCGGHSHELDAYFRFNVAGLNRTVQRDSAVVSRVG